MDSRITVSREPDQYVDRGRAYGVLVDGDKIGKLKAGETKSFPVSPGEHRVQLAIDWCRSPVRTVTVEPGQEARLHGRPRAKSPFGVLVYTIFKRDRYLDLQVV